MRVLLASGTATLEAALLKRPMVVAYRMGALSWLLLSLAGEDTLRGAAQYPRRAAPWCRSCCSRRLHPPAMAAALRPLLAGEPAAARQVDAFEDIHRQLRQGFGERAAEALAALAEGRRV